MITELELPKDLFSQPKLLNLQVKNFIFGKNGTGKSSITKCIEEQYSETYDVRIFQGFERIIRENAGLNSIALGSENVKIKSEIDNIKKELLDLNNELGSKDNLEDTIYGAYSEQYKYFTEKYNEIDDFYRNCAKTLKNESPELFGTTYNKNKFKEDVAYKKKATNEEIREAESNFTQTKLLIGPKLEFKIENINDWIRHINEDILASDLIEPNNIKFNNDKERNWVHDGIELHEEKNICLFCGSDLSEVRKSQLNIYFNDRISKLNTDINLSIKGINNIQGQIESISSINDKDFLKVYHNQIEKLNAQLDKIKLRYLVIIDDLRNKLKNKQQNPFSVLPPYEETSLYEEVIEFNKSYNCIYENNKKDISRLDDIKKDAKTLIYNHKIYELCEDFNYDKKIDILKAEKRKLDEIINRKKSKENQISDKKSELNNLRRKTIDETIAVTKINKLISSLGNQSFSLVKSEELEESGNYIIHDINNNVRDINTLSTGEKNILAFLWFVCNLENEKIRSDKQQVVVFDDPMNSNDDTTQYLIITELQKLLRNSKDDRDKQIFILTHNIHFYLNTRYNCWQKSKGTTIHLLKNRAVTDVIEILSKKDDFSTSYDALWNELKWLYKNEDACPEYMLNPIRRIWETYKKFNVLDNSLYDCNQEAKKLFDVNSHSIDDLEADLNGKSKGQIIQILKSIFKENNGESHFNAHWDLDEGASH